ncbi:hypothetical protein GGF41_005041 [Coemansia sp. RSA 2531]|nr:hypothetical protein GGF41_005041 [Coemansia sp. RSA 2531]
MQLASITTKGMATTLRHPSYSSRKASLVSLLLSPTSSRHHSSMPIAAYRLRRQRLMLRDTRSTSSSSNRLRRWCMPTQLGPMAAILHTTTRFMRQATSLITPRSTTSTHRSPSSSTMPRRRHSLTSNRLCSSNRLPSNISSTISIHRHRINSSSKLLRL